MADTRPPRPPRDIRRRHHSAGARSFAAIALAAGMTVSLLTPRPKATEAERLAAVFAAREGH